MTPQRSGQGATRLYHVTVTIVIGIAATLQRLDLWRWIDVGSAAVRQCNGDRSVFRNLYDFRSICGQACKELIR